MTIASGCEYRLRVQSGLTEHLVERLHRGDQSLLDLQQDSITLGFSQPQIELQLAGKKNGLLGLGGGLITLDHRFGQGEGQ